MDRERMKSVLLVIGIIAIIAGAIILLICTNNYLNTLSQIEDTPVIGGYGPDKDQMRANAFIAFIPSLGAPLVLILMGSAMVGVSGAILKDGEGVNSTETAVKQPVLAKVTRKLDSSDIITLRRVLVKNEIIGADEQGTSATEFNAKEIRALKVMLLHDNMTDKDSLNYTNLTDEDIKALQDMLA